jgi:hypothetical protein
MLGQLFIYLIYLFCLSGAYICSAYQKLCTIEGLKHGIFYEDIKILLLTIS